MPERETRPTRPAANTSAGMIPTFALPGESTPGQFGPIIVTPRAPDVGAEPEHVVHRDVLGDADDGRDPGVDRLVDGVGREARRDEDERGVGARLGDRLGDRAEDRDALDVLAALARRHAGDDVRAVGAVAQAVEAALAAGQALDDEPRVAVDQDRHQAGRARSDDPVEPEDAAVDAVGEQLADARRRLARAAGPGEPGLELDGFVEDLDLLDLEACAGEEAAPLGLAVVADVRRVAKLLGLLELLADEDGVRNEDPLATRPGRALATPAPDIGEVVRRDPRDREVEARSANGSSSARQIDVRLHPRRRVAAHDLEPGLAQPPRDVPAAGRDVDRRPASLRPLDDQVEVRPFDVHRARPVELGPLAPGIAHSQPSLALDYCLGLASR